MGLCQLYHLGVLILFIVGSFASVSVTSWQKDVMLAIRDGSVPRLTSLLKDTPGELHQLLSDGFCNGLPPLCYAAKTNSATVKTLLEHGADPRLAYATTKTTPLSFAAMSGEVKAVKILLDALSSTPSDVNAVDDHGSTALALCGLTCNAHVAKLLVDAGADVFTDDNNGNTALHIGAFYCGDKVPDHGKQFAETLLSSGGKEITWTLDDINRISASGRTALMLSAKQGGDGYSQVLLNKGADPEIVSVADGNTYHDFARLYQSSTKEL